MWEIFESRQLLRHIDKLPKEILKRYEKWKDIIRCSGPGGLHVIKGFHDESLKGEWLGYRSSRLGLQFRVIYRVERKEVLVEVFDVSAHDYRRK